MRYGVVFRIQRGLAQDGTEPAPYRGIGQTSGGVRLGERRGVVTPPYGSNAGSAQQRADVGIGPYEMKREAAATAGAAL